MSSPLKIYRVHCFDAAMNSVYVNEIKAATDEEAIAMAQAGRFGDRCELWDGKRLVAEIQAERRTG